MSQTLFKNEDDMIMFGQDGNAFCEQYEFGKSFQNRMGLNNYIGITNLNLPFIYECLMWGVLYPGAGILINGAGNVNNSIFCQNSTFTNIYFNNNLSVSYNSGNFLNTSNYDVSLYKTLLSFSQSENYRSLRHWGRSSYQSSTGISLPASINNIYIGGWATANSASLTSFAHASTQFNKFLLYSRLLSDAEKTHFYQNGQGSEPMSYVGLEIYLKIDFAEVINIAGTDYPCFRDYSGNNRHGIIYQLPAGTAQQKVDYVNAYLAITKFII